jgi:hypothetical protein
VPSIAQDNQRKLLSDLLLWADDPLVAVAAARAGLLASAASAAERASGVPGNEGERLVRAALLIGNTPPPPRLAGRSLATCYEAVQAGPCSPSPTRFLAGQPGCASPGCCCGSCRERGHGGR